MASVSKDGTVLLWDVASWCRGGTERRTIGREDLPRLWTDLAHENADRAYRAIWTLADNSQNAVSLIRQHLHPISPVEPRRLDRLIFDLDNNHFAVRNRAAEELENLAELAEPSLKKVTGDKPSLEKRQRAERCWRRANSWQDRWSDCANVGRLKPWKRPVRRMHVDY